MSTEKKYLAALRIIADDGSLIEGNFEFFTEQTINSKTVEELKKQYAKQVSQSGHQCHSSNVVLFGLIPLEG